MQIPFPLEGHKVLLVDWELVGGGVAGGTAPVRVGRVKQGHRHVKVWPVKIVFKKGQMLSLHFHGLIMQA